MSERNIEKLKTVSEIEREAFAALPQVARDVLFRGASREQTLEDNEKAYERIRFCPSVLRDVGMVSVSTELLGIKLSSPILLAPTAYHGLYHPNKEVETVSGANLSKTPYVVSEYSSTALAELAHISKVPLLLNLIVHEDRLFTKGVIENAISSGVKALVVTVDQPVRSLHSRKVEVGVTLPPGIERVNFKAYVPTAAQQSRIQRRSYHYLFFNPTQNWNDIEWLITNSSIPVFLKGVLNPKDAIRAMNAGVAGIMISNHGGRNLEGK